MAITDPDSPLSKVAENSNFRKLYINFSDIGGRYSALSYFGLVPAALMGIDISELLKRTRSMVSLCSPEVPTAQNPGVVLGTTLAELALAGHDKLLYNVASDMQYFGWWLEQLIAESTGKEGKGILPIDHHLSTANLNKSDKVFLTIDLQTGSAQPKEKKLCDTPSIRISLEDEYDIGAEFFRWEVATAVAGSLLGLNPFDQPNVEDSKKETIAILHQIGITGQIPPMEVSFIHDSVKYYATQKAGTVQLLMEKFFATSKPKDYIVLQAYLPENANTCAELTAIAASLEKNLLLPVSIQFGPRYLHSTGQYHKGGPDTGFFIQFISTAEDEIDIPGRNYTFGILKKAQAIGDRQALLDNHRNVILIDTGKRVLQALQSFKQLSAQITSPENRKSNPVFAYNNTEKVFEVSSEILITNDQLNSTGKRLQA